MMIIEVREWDLESDGEIVPLESTGLTEPQRFDVGDVETLEEGLDVISDNTGWCILSAIEVKK